MKTRGKKRLIVGVCIAILTFVAYSILIAPQVRQIEAMAGSFTGSLMLASPEGQEQIKVIGTVRSSHGSSDWAGLRAAWGWRLRSRPAEQ